MAFRNRRNVSHLSKAIILLLGLFIIGNIVHKLEIHSFSSQTAEGKDFPNITIMVRTANTPRLLSQFYCMYLRSVRLFWPASYGSMSLVLDAESEKDHKFGDSFKKQMQKLHPEIPVYIHYEPLPKDPHLLAHEHSVRSPEYNRQLWSTFLADLYAKEPIIAYMDTDIQIRTPITKKSIFGRGGKLKVFGEASKNHILLGRWKNSVMEAIGKPLMANFMITFPQFIYRDTYTNCRKFLMTRFNTTNFEVAVSKFFGPHKSMGTINQIMAYAWYYEHDRYDWHIKTKNIHANNKHLPEGHKIQPNDTIPDIVPVGHISQDKKWKPHLMLEGYCMSLKAAGKSVPACQNVTHNTGDLCEYWEGFLRYAWPSAKTWCKAGEISACCKEAMVDHYKDVAVMAKQNLLTFDKKDVYEVDEMAKELDVKCPKIDLP